MAYPTICPECQNEEHDSCSAQFEADQRAFDEDYKDTPVEDRPIGGPFCVCSHTSEKGKFELSVRKRLDARRV
jgi:hypothetical protein